MCRYLRCQFVRKTDKGAFIVAAKGREFCVEHIDERSDDDFSVEDDPAADAADAALQCVARFPQRNVLIRFVQVQH